MLLGCPGHCGKLLGVLVNVVLGEHHKWVMKVLPSRLLPWRAFSNIWGHFW